MVKWLFLSIPVIWALGFLVVVDARAYAILSGLILGLLLVIGLLCVWRAPDTRATLKDAWARIFD